jgi:hypothetical protein
VIRAIVFTALLGACRPGSSTVPEARADEPASASTSVAVVELFTSEGCSSCPAADDVLSELARTTDRRVYPLAFHVDYWDSLGWPDRFASPDNTSRQRTYALSFGRGGLYTPQMVVNGTEEFTGSDRARAKSAVTHAIARPASVKLMLHPRSRGSNALAVEYEVAGAPAGALLNVAIVERAASTSVLAGENAGRTLHHANIVRSFSTATIGSPTGSITVRLPSPLPHEEGEVVVYVQESSGTNGGRPILGAARAPLP